MRLNIRTLFLTISTFIIICTVSLWSNCSNQTFDKFSKNIKSDYESLVQNIKPIDCLINGNKIHVDCLLKNNTVYIPFSFLKNYFEIYGKIIETGENKKKFHWSHSYSKIYQQNGKYDSRGVFTNFQNYKVEERDRVKCVSASEGVPVSTQWNPHGYYYPTQIAQFGLSHYSKNLTLPSPKITVLENGQLNPLWNVPETSKIQIVFNAQANSNVIDFFSTDKPISLKIDSKEEFFISFDVALSLSTSSSIVVTIKDMKEKNEVWNLHYICSRTFIFAKGHNIYHGMHCSREFGWKKLTRNVLIDLQKGLHVLKKTTTKMFRSKYKLCDFKLYGVGFLDNLTLSSSDHISQFYAAAHWFNKHQNKESGGWINPVTRKISPFIKPLKPGWLSAMGQGQAISLLSRAFYHSGGNEVYLNTAYTALKPFKISSKDGGVLSKFMNLHPWYDEYPTVPPIFILNGFMYSLIGLYDLFSLAPNGSEVSQEAYSLWKQGMISLKNLLPLFDMGSRSAYDLRHVTLDIAPNIARWDYHATHINQLLLLATLDNATVIQTTAKRWIGYMNGARASHN
ncbi:D-glucuronyl C5-epimerase [Melanaphis sacchari]|uniref:heparosan-N-sulfate-glucuronate 5-epimerase n=1 Tax=Melanaphis sacchari TaxID=742174 RepID=A0A2H8TLN4_9HEMI|nr:D-glucuronyl C5-epimerase [Melanaphis sacchari]XP_025203396.1 D-glucuronyl C5-epimerase [Melanaphis sacchari]